MDYNLLKLPDRAAGCSAPGGTVCFWLSCFWLEKMSVEKGLGECCFYHSHRLQIKVASKPPSDIDRLLMDRVLRPDFISKPMQLV